MADRILFRPIRMWPHQPTPTWKRKAWSGAKNLTLTRALDNVASELRRLGCDKVAYIECDVDEKHIRLDGELRSGASPRSPGCIIYARHARIGDLRWACDRYSRIEYNVRAIAATIEALRAVDRWGCVRDNEQFTGFKALPETASPTVTRDRAIELLRFHSGRVLTKDAAPDLLREAHRAARSRTHPDRNGGDQKGFDEVELAARVLGLINA